MPVKYYPKLTELVNDSLIPDNMGFLREALSAILSGLHYRNFHTELSAQGDAYYHELDLINL